MPLALPRAPQRPRRWGFLSTGFSQAEGRPRPALTKATALGYMLAYKPRCFQQTRRPCAATNRCKRAARGLGDGGRIGRGAIPPRLAGFRTVEGASLLRPNINAMISIAK